MDMDEPTETIAFSFDPMDIDEPTAAAAVDFDPMEIDGPAELNTNENRSGKNAFRCHSESINHQDTKGCPTCKHCEPHHLHVFCGPCEADRIRRWDGTLLTIRKAEDLFPRPEPDSPGLIDRVISSIRKANRPGFQYKALARRTRGQHD